MDLFVSYLYFTVPTFIAQYSLLSNVQRFKHVQVFTLLQQMAAHVFYLDLSVVCIQIELCYYTN